MSRSAPSVVALRSATTRLSSCLLLGSGRRSPYVRSEAQSGSWGCCERSFYRTCAPTSRRWGYDRFGGHGGGVLDVLSLGRLPAVVGIVGDAQEQSKVVGRVAVESGLGAEAGKLVAHLDDGGFGSDTACTVFGGRLQPVLDDLAHQPHRLQVLACDVAALSGRSHLQQKEAFHGAGLGAWGIEVHPCEACPWVSHARPPLPTSRSGRSRRAAGRRGSSRRWSDGSSGRCCRARRRRPQRCG